MPVQVRNPFGAGFFENLAGHVCHLDSKRHELVLLNVLLRHFLVSNLVD